MQMIMSTFIESSSILSTLVFLFMLVSAVTEPSESRCRAAPSSSILSALAFRFVLRHSRRALCAARRHSRGSLTAL